MKRPSMRRRLSEALGRLDSALHLVKFCRQGRPRRWILAVGVAPYTGCFEYVISPTAEGAIADLGRRLGPSLGVPLPDGSWRSVPIPRFSTLAELEMRLDLEGR